MTGHGRGRGELGHAETRRRGEGREFCPQMDADGRGWGKRGRGAVISNPAPQAALLALPWDGGTLWDGEWDGRKIKIPNVYGPWDGGTAVHPQDTPLPPGGGR
jgi:hypothetical protein